MQQASYKITHEVSVLDRNGNVITRHPPQSNMITDAGLAFLRAYPAAALGRNIFLGNAETPDPTYLSSGAIVATASGTAVTATGSIFLAAHASNKNEIVFSTGARARIVTVVSGTQITLDQAVVVTSASFRIEYGHRTDLTSAFTTGYDVSQGVQNNYSMQTTQVGTVTNLHTRTFAVPITGVGGADVAITEIGLSPESDGDLAAIWNIPFGPVVVPDGGTFIDRVGIVETVSTLSFSSSNPFTGLTVNTQAGVVPLLCGIDYMRTVTDTGDTAQPAEYESVVASAAGDQNYEDYLVVRVDTDTSSDFTKQDGAAGASFEAEVLVTYDGVNYPRQVTYSAAIPAASFPAGWRSIGLYDTVNFTWVFRVLLSAQVTVPSGKMLNVSFVKKWGRS